MVDVIRNSWNSYVIYGREIENVFHSNTERVTDESGLNLTIKRWTKAKSIVLAAVHASGIPNTSIQTLIEIDATSADKNIILFLFITTKT